MGQTGPSFPVAGNRSESHGAMVMPLVSSRDVVQWIREHTTSTQRRDNVGSELLLTALNTLPRTHQAIAVEAILQQQQRALLLLNATFAEEPTDRGRLVVRRAAEDVDAEEEVAAIHQLEHANANTPEVRAANTFRRILSRRVQRLKDERVQRQQREETVNQTVVLNLTRSAQDLEDIVAGLNRMQQLTQELTDEHDNFHLHNLPPIPPGGN